MDQSSGAFPFAPAMLEQHYKQVLSFQEARTRSARLLSKGALVALVVSMVANAGLGWAVASMLPLTKLVPVLSPVSAYETELVS